MPEGIIYKKLDNGFSYYLLPEDSERGKITVNLVSTVGSLVEQTHERGVAHFIEHMVFKGSKNYPGLETMRTLDKMGLRMGRDYNASVNGDNTEYHINLPEGNWDYLKQTLLLMKDWVGDLEMEESSFKVEQKVVIEEIRKRPSRFSPYLNGTILEGHDGLGTEDQINSITAEQVRNFYSKYYKPDKFALVIQGKVNEKKVAAFIDKLFGALPKNTDNLVRDYMDLSSTTVIDSNFESPVAKNENLLILAFKLPSYSVDDFAAFRRNFTQYIFNKILEHRLSSYSGHGIKEAKVSNSNILPGTLMFNFRLKGDESVTYKTMLETFCKVVADARTHGFTQKEIDFYINDFIKWNEINRNEEHCTLIDVLQHVLHGDVPLSKVSYLKLLRELQDDLKPQDFNSLLNEFPDYYKTILYNSSLDYWTEGFNEAYILNELASINQKYVNQKAYTFGNLKSSFVIRSKPDMPEIHLEKIIPEVILSKKQLGTGLYLLKYKNGLSVVVNNDPEVSPEVRIVSKHGLNRLPNEDRLLFSEAVRYLNSKFGDYSSEESSALLRNYLISDKTFVNKDYYEFEMRCNNVGLNYENLLKAFHLVVGEEQVPDSSVIIDRLNKSKVLNEEDKAKFNNQMLMRLFNYNQMFKRNFKGAYVYVGGDLPEDIDDLISTYLASVAPVSIPQTISFEKEEESFPNLNYIEESRGSLQKRASFIFKRGFSEAYTLEEELIATIISEYGYMRMFDILRKKYGLVYSLGATGFGSKGNKVSTVSLRYIADNTNLTRCKELMTKEVLKPMSQGIISDEDIAISKAKVTSKFYLNFYEDEVLSDTYLKMGLQYGKLFSLEELKRAIDKISPKLIREQMKYLIDVSEPF
ncbi:hypothetical protein GCM10023163_09700 [Aestuariibaculum suncheonense]